MATKTCPRCKTEFKYTSYLKRHLLTSASCSISVEEVENIIVSKNSDIICSHCNKKFTKISCLSIHNKNSKCGKLQQSLQVLVKPRIITQEEIDNITTLEEAKNIIKNQNKLISQTNNQPIIPQNITNNTNNTNSNNNTINNIQNITINQNINIINPFSCESIPNLPFEEMLKILKSEKPEIEILKLVYSDIQNNNFFKYNMNKQGVAYLTVNNSIDTVQEKQFRQNILENSKDLLKTMLLICTKKLSIKDASKIYSRIDNIETMLKNAIYNKDLKNSIYDKNLNNAIYDNDLTNYLESQFRQNSKNNKKKLTDFVSNVNDNPEVKEKFYKTIEDNKIQKDNQNIILTPEISLSKINEKLGDLTSAIELSFENVSDDFMLNKFEDTRYYKYMKNRIDKEYNFIKKNKKANCVDYNELNKRYEQIENSIRKMEAIHIGYNNGSLLIIDIPQLYQTETIRKNNETNQLALT
jgi:hypothetical protein